MSVTDTYGVKGRAHGEVSREIEKLLDLAFVLRDSSFLGEYDLFEGRGGEQIRLLKNGPVFPDDELLYPEFPDHSVILEVFRPERDQALHEALLTGVPGLVHLSSSHSQPPT